MCKKRWGTSLPKLTISTSKSEFSFQVCHPAQSSSSQPSPPPVTMHSTSVPAAVSALHPCPQHPSHGSAHFPSSFRAVLSPFLKPLCFDHMDGPMPIGTHAADKHLQHGDLGALTQQRRSPRTPCLQATEMVLDGPCLVLPWWSNGLI